MMFNSTVKAVECEVLINSQVFSSYVLRCFNNTFMQDRTGSSLRMMSSVVVIHLSLLFAL